MTESISSKSEKTGNLDIAFYTLITLLSVIVLAGYIFIASRSFFFQDDFVFLDPLVFKKLIRQGMREVYEFRPLSRDLFFLTSYRLFGLEPFGYFMVNIIAHTLSAICLFFLLVRLRLSHKLSALVSFLYFSNVAAFEKVTWISNFQHTSYHLFLLLSALFIILPLREIRRLSLSVLCWICALLSNMASIFFPAILMLLLSIGGLPQDNHDAGKRIAPLLKTTTAHWIVLLIYAAFVLIPAWTQPNIGNPYSLDISISTFLDNLHYYWRNFLFSNAGRFYLIVLATLYALFFVTGGLKKFFMEKKLLFNFIALMLISGFSYAPFAFLRYQRYPNYVSLALIPWYIIILFPLFSKDMLARAVSPFRKIALVIFVCLLTISFLPNEQQLTKYFENSPRLHIYSLWKQTESVIPEIPKGIRRVVFVDKEAFKPHRYVDAWKRPPFWWQVGHGSMFRILYNRRDIQFDYSTREIITPEPNTLYITVDRDSDYYSLSLMPPVQNSVLP